MVNENEIYENNLNKLKQIVEEIKEGSLSVDSLVKKSKEAMESAKICLEILKKERGNFKTIEEELNNIMEELDSIIK